MMRKFRFFIVCFALLFVCSATQAQFLKKLGNAAKNAAENAVTRKTEQKVDKAVSGAIDKATDADTYKSSGKEEKESSNADNSKVETTKADNSNIESAAADNTAPATPKAAEMAYAKSDFVPGDEIIFEDLLTGEQVGEFPSMWDLKRGNAEVASVNGENAIHLERETLIMPFMKEKDYLPDVFTIEFDLYVPVFETNQGGRDKVEINSRYNIDLLDASGKNVFQIHWYNSSNSAGKESRIGWTWKAGGENNSGETRHMFNLSDFNHIAISFNKRALKVYLNGIRLVNIPRCDAPTRFQLFSYQGYNLENRFIKNVRIAKGAVPLYDRMMTDGKIITYGITFDVGKSTIKPESMGEINRIAKLMSDNPDLKFSVEGHTDNTGSAATNQTLSDARSKAVLDKLVELGIDSSRLKSAGKGQNSPIADNSTDEGRAKNRRVEFVKM
jgi:outer membrane protein OmpA-like peptidoglycan-associated protein